MKPRPSPTRPKAAAAPATRVQRPVPLLLRPFAWLKRQLARQLKLQRTGRRFRLVLEPVDGMQTSQHAVPARATGKAGPAAARPADDAPTGMQAELQQLLAQHAQSRHFMRHLGYIERLLRLGGPDALNEVPLEVLRKATTQLEDMVSDWSSAGLAELRLRLAVLIADKEETARQFQPSNSALSDFDTPQRLQVSEATASVFEAVAAQSLRKDEKV